MADSCKHGHPLSGDNLYVHDGHRHCRTCRRSALSRQRQKDPVFHRERQVVWRTELKAAVLSHYGPNGALRCSWPNCEVVDIDMLTLDHINDDGAQHRREMKGSRKQGGGSATYAWVKREGFPEGFQTLCCNHQTKKELLRKRTDA